MTRPLTYEAAGTIQAEAAATLAAQLTGTVVAVRVREGDRVKQGDGLVVIDERQVDARRRQAESALDEARRAAAAAAAARDAAAASADLARATHARYQALLAQVSVSRQEFDEVQARFRQSQAALAQSEDMLKAAGERVRQAEAALTSARVSQSDATVRAPYDGVVTAKHVEVGDLAAAGMPLLGLEKEGAHRVDVFVPVAYVARVAPGGPAAVRLDLQEPLQLEGTVVTVVPAADPGSRSVLVKIRLPAASGLRSGMFARVALAVGEQRLIAIPASAVVTRGQLSGVFVLAADNVARFRLIRIGRRLGETVEVVAGLAEGARFVVDPAPPMADGRRVEASS
jgi:RND family efflux transporter MFP subunit